MTAYALINANNEILRIEVFAALPPVLAPEKGLRWVRYREKPDPQPPLGYRVTSRELKEVDGEYEWVSTVERLPAPDLEELVRTLKAAKNDAVNRERLRANTATFMFDGKPIACDELSRSDIDGVAGYIALFGDFPPGWPGVWKAADNTYVPMTNIAHFRAMYAAMAGAGLANFMRAQEKKQQLAEATTIAEVESIEP
jgi:hypothetical protein